MIRFDNISLSFGDKKIIDGLSFNFVKGKKYALMGESGIGKTTILGIISGILKANSGTVVLDSDKISYAFQDDRLFPWLTVIENVILVSDEPKNIAKTKAAEILDRLGLGDILNMYPEELSGGMRQRVSIARALMYDFDILLLDEPFRALDEATAKQVAEYVFAFSEDKTVIFVTHDKNDTVYADYVINISDSPITALTLVKCSSGIAE